MASEFGDQSTGIKADPSGPDLNLNDAHIKLEPPSAAASPAAHSDEDIYEDAGDLDFSGTQQGLFLTRIPKYLWESWSALDDEQEIQLGTVRIEGGLENIKRMSLALSPHVVKQRNVPREYNMQMLNRDILNTYIFTEKDLHGYAAKNQKGTNTKIGSGAFTSQAPRPWFQNRPTQNSQPRDSSKRWQPYRRTIPKQTALVGQIKTEINCLPVENADYKRTMDARTREAMSKPRRETKMVDKQPHGGVYAARQANAFEIGFTKQTKPAAGKGQHFKAARIPANELKDMIFNCFRKYEYWPMRALKAQLDQPENYLKQVLEEIAQLIRNGPFANCWQLRPEYKESSYDNVKIEAAPVIESGDTKDVDEGDVSADDDEGHINLHKAHTPSLQHTPHEQTGQGPPGFQVARGFATSRPTRSSPYRTASGRGRGASRPYTRNHSLVLNSKTAQSPTLQTLKSPIPTSGTDPLQPAAAYVTKRGRHKQLINTSVLEKVTLQRKQAIEESQQRKALTTDQWERQRMHQYLKALDTKCDSSNGSTAQLSSASRTQSHQIEIDGLKFQMMKGGSKLARIYGQRPFGDEVIPRSPHKGPSDIARSTPKRTTVHGVTFVRSKQGNLYRSGVVRASNDVSSDDDEHAETDGEDIDSDDLDDDFIEGVDESAGQALAEQDDFVGF
ncbi:MAG: hypothetical protein Q9179_003171 [Wetmoreana sp. 5 TL-2023]